MSRKVPHRPQLNLAAFAEEVVSDLAPVLRTSARVQLAVDVGVAADPHRLRQILVNLVSNADRHNAADGIITVTVDRDGPWARLCVVDQGPGCPTTRSG